MKGQLLPLEGTINTRDLGGYPTKDGHVIAKKRLIRSDHLNQLTDRDMDFLKNEMQLKWIIDLRGKREISQKPDRIPHGVNYLHLPLLREHRLKYSQENEKTSGLAGQFAATAQAMGGDVMGDFIQMYHSLAIDFFSIFQYRQFIEILLKEEDGSILWHCAAGKDRTGFITILILWFLGVEPGIIQEDYMETNGYFVDAIQELDDQLMAEGADLQLREQMRIICSVYPEFYHAIFQGIERGWTGMDNFLRKGVGLTSLKQKRMKSLFLK